MTRAELATLIKSKNPAYKDIPDEELVSAIIKKYPIYANQLDEKPVSAPSGYDLLSHRGMALDSPMDETGKPLRGDSPFLSKLKGMMAGAAAPPTSLLDLAKKITLYTLPSAGSVGSFSGVGGDLIPDTVGRGLAATKAAVGETSGVGSALSLPLRIAGKFGDALPTKMAAKVAEFKGDGGATPFTAPMSPGSAGSDLYAIAKSNHEPFTPSSGPGGGGAPMGTRPPSSGGVPPSAPNTSDGMLDQLLSKLGGKGPAEPQSMWPPEGGQGDWHSGAEPGSAEAKAAQGLHRDTGELDSLYRQKINDPLAALLMSLGIGAGAAGAQR